MLKSMTGFGRGSYEDADFSVNIEMKTVNHRYNEVAIRLPRFLNPLEDKIRKTILKTVRSLPAPKVKIACSTCSNCTTLRWSISVVPATAAPAAAVWSPARWTG